MIFEVAEGVHNMPRERRQMGTVHELMPASRD